MCTLIGTEVRRFSEKVDRGAVVDRDSNVTITLEKISCSGIVFLRPILVSGEVETAVTKGRKGAPAPICGYAVSQTEAGPNYQNGSVLNVGLVDGHRGHVMALELGGPDVPENIVPQWAMWQSNGPWREFEKSVKKLADRNAGRINFYAEVVYRQTARCVGQRRSRFPVGFIVDVSGADGKILLQFADEQRQIATDDLVGIERAEFRETGEVPEGYRVATNRNSGEQKLKRKRTKGKDAASDLGALMYSGPAMPAGQTTKEEAEQSLKIKRRKLNTVRVNYSLKGWVDLDGDDAGPAGEGGAGGDSDVVMD